MGAGFTKIYLVNKNWKKIEYKTAPKVRKLNARPTFIPEFTTEFSKQYYDLFKNDKNFDWILICAHNMIPRAFLQVLSKKGFEIS